MGWSMTRFLLSRRDNYNASGAWRGSRAQGLQVDGRPVGALLSMWGRRTPRQELLGART